MFFDLVSAIVEVYHVSNSFLVRNFLLTILFLCLSEVFFIFIHQEYFTRKSETSKILQFGMNHVQASAQALDLFYITLEMR